MENDLLNEIEKKYESERPRFHDILEKLIFDFNIDTRGEIIGKEINTNYCSHCNRPKTGINTNATNSYDLFKPFQKTKQFSSIDIEIINFNKQIQLSVEAKKDFVFIKLGGFFEKIMLDSILFIECQKNYLFLTTDQRECRIRGSLKDFTTKLPDVFIKTHKSFIVNGSKIENFNNNFISINNKKIPISNTYREDVLIKLNHSLL
jgi:hypothetical protein